MPSLPLVQNGSELLQTPTMVETRIATWCSATFRSAVYLLDLPSPTLEDGMFFCTVQMVLSTGLTCGWNRSS